MKQNSKIKEIIKEKSLKPTINKIKNNKKRIIKKDQYGNVVYKETDRMKEFSEYDDKGNKTYYKNTLFGTEWRATHDEEGRKLYYKDLNLGDEYWIEYGKKYGKKRLISKVLQKTAGNYYLNGQLMEGAYEK